MTLPDLLYELGRWSIEAVWIPMLVWTALALPIFLIQRLIPGISPHTRYLTTIGLLYALPLGMVIGASVVFEAGPVRDVAAVVTISAYVAPAQPAAGAGFSWTHLHSAGVLTLLAVFLAVLRAAMLAGAVRELRCIRAGAAAPASAAARVAAAELAARMGIRKDLRVEVSATQASPLTFGWRSPVVLIPQRLLDSPRDLRLALAHELVHIRRHDYLWQVWEHVVGAFFFIHPLVAILRTEASTLREITCDAVVLALTGERSRYARLLYRYSTRSDVGRQLAVGILLRESHLKKRIDAMKDLFDFTRLNRSKRVGLAVSATLLTLTVVVVACSDALVDSSSRSDVTAALTTNDAGDDGAYAIVEQMPELIGGLASIQNNLRYPELARQAGVSGRVIVQFVVNERGEVTDPTVVKGIGSGLDEAALAAVRQAAFKPGMQGGKPVPVKMALPISFALDEGAGGPSDAAVREGDMKVDMAAADFGEVDQMPEILGGLQAIMQDVKYPGVAAKSGIEGRVLVEFVVTKEGTTRDARVVEGLGAGLDEEALRAVARARFTPAMKDGEAVPVKLALPFTFRLPGDEGPGQLLRKTKR